MKRLKWIIPVALLLVLLIIIVTFSPATDPHAPRYVVVQSQPTGPFPNESYQWNSSAPFRDGKTWIFTIINRTNHHDFFYDLDNRKVLGELFNAGVAFANRDQTKLLCEGYASPAASFKQRCIALLNRLSLHKALIATNTIESFWILDVKNNSARRVGQLSQQPGYGSSWRPAPGFRFGFNVPSNNDTNSFFLCDIETGAFRKIKHSGKLRGWWSDHEILFNELDGSFQLFDVLTDKTATLFTADTTRKICQDLGLPPTNLTPLSSWNGTNYDFFFSGAPYWDFEGESFLLKADKTIPTLRLFAQNFKFGYLGRMDTPQTHYVYNGNSGTWGNGGNGAVYLRNLTNNTTTTLVPPDSSGQYALPRIYGDSVLYHQNRQLWTIKLDGSGNTRLFPSAEAVMPKREGTPPE